MIDFSFEETGLSGVYKITPFFIEDNRGYFLKDFTEDIMKDHISSFELKETFYSKSVKGTIRGCHFQLYKPQSKLVRCLSGHIWDVVIDLRPSSSSYKKWEGFHLTEENKLMLFIPVGFAHGFMAIEDSLMSYKCSRTFYQKGDSGIYWRDDDLGIEWPIDLIGGEKNIIQSEKDKNLMSLSEYEDLLDKGDCWSL